MTVGRPLADGDLLLSRADGTRLPVRDYSREFAASESTSDREFVQYIASTCRVTNR
jgi:hypothetical protein